MLETSSNEVRICCPFCKGRKGRADDKFHLYANPDKGAFICHRCGARGSISLLIDDSAEPVISKDWYEEVVSLLSVDARQTSLDLRQEVKLPDDVVEIRSGSPAGRYLKKRGFGRFEINEYRLVEQPDRYRLVIPSYRDELIDFWVSRTYINEEPKYLNPKGASRRFALFGFDQAKGDSRVVICEGVFSAMAARQATGISSVATYGKLVAAEQVKLLLTLKPKEFIVAFDSDADSEAMMLAEILSVSKDSAVKIVNWSQLPKGEHDPDSVKRAVFERLVADAPQFNWHQKVMRMLA